MTTNTRREAPHHDKLTCYTDYGCRLPACVERKRQWQREARNKQKHGQWQPFVDAAPVRQHLLDLQAQGVPVNRVALVSGVDKETVRAFVPGSDTKRRPAKHRVRAEYAARILAVTAEQARAAVMDSTGTRRRIQALVALGWPIRELSHAFGLSAPYAHDLLKQADTNRGVWASTAEKVADGYNQLRNTRPSRYGVNASRARRARNLASSNRWPKPQYWDQHPDAIDDPHFTPEYGFTRAELLAEEARWLIETGGLSRTQAAERLRKDRSYIDRVLGTEYEAAA
jgi:hypothetical protein